MLGDDEGSRMVLLSDRAEATFRVHFADENKPDLDILMEEFIDEKSAKAKGKRVSTLEIASFEDITPEPVIEEPEPEELEPAEEVIDVEGVPMTIEAPQDTQLDLF